MAMKDVDLALGGEPRDLASDQRPEPRPAAQEAISVLHEAGEDGWALWAWFATPSAWLGGRIPADLLATDPDRVTATARQRAAAAA